MVSLRCREKGVYIVVRISKYNGLYIAGIISSGSHGKEMVGLCYTRKRTQVVEVSVPQNNYQSWIIKKAREKWLWGRKAFPLF
jgi:hypothetical protein